MKIYFGATLCLSVAVLFWTAHAARAASATQTVGNVTATITAPDIVETFDGRSILGGDQLFVVPPK